MFFVYSLQSQKVQEYKDLASLIEGYEKSHTMGDLFWTLGLKSWVTLAEVVTDNVLKKRKFQIPALPASAQAPKAEPVVMSEPEEDFKIISYEPPTAPVPAGSAKPKIASTTENKRKFPRYDIRLKVIISNKEKTFLSYTSNVSIGGVALEDNIPAEYFADAKDTEIFISSPKKNEFLAFRCQPVGDDADPKRFSFGQISEESLSKFQQWIDKLKT